jgi:hypothetical protein
MIALTDRFSRAVDYARIAHAAQFRKGSSIPYIYHLLGVTSVVIEFGGSEDQAIAGLLHDTLEDCGASHEAVIRAQFGDAVADIVKDCTDGTAEGKAGHTDPDAKRRDWIERKRAYLAHLKHLSRHYWSPRATNCITPAPSCRIWRIRMWARGCSLVSPAGAMARSVITRHWRKSSCRARSRLPK